ncbi:MAG: iron-containing alcohol dehydrogenase [Methanobacteriota archaeon]
MVDFEYFQPTKISFGKGAFKKLSGLKGRKVLLVTGSSSMRKAGFLDEAVKLLQPAKVVLFEGVENDPSFETVDRIVESVGDSDFIVGLGGGSVLDAAKAASVVATNEGDAMDFIEGRKIVFEGIPFVAVPTTSGTGSEVTRASVLTDRERGVKKTLRSPLMFPYQAIVDPALTFSCPPKLTAAVGIDALTHAIEAYTSRLANPISDGFAEKAVKLILENLEGACKDGSDENSRSKMSLGSLLAGLALSAASSGVAHRIAHGVGGRYHAAHGEILAQLLPKVLEFNLPSCGDRMRKLSKLNNFRSPLDFIEKITSLRDALSLPRRLSEFGVKKGDIPWIVDQSLSSPSIRYNAREVTEQDLTALLENML